MISQVALEKSEMPGKLALLLDLPPPPAEKVRGFVWNEDDRSSNIRVLGDGAVCQRLPVAQSTDCVRGNTGFSSGLHVWEITWEVKQRGTHAMIGVASSSAPLHVTGSSAPPRVQTVQVCHAS